MPIIGTIASSTRQGLSTTAYESIATVVVSSSVANIEFTSIPSNYAHLQIRAIGRTTSTSGSSFRIQVGNNTIDTNANYMQHQLGGQSPASTFSDGAANTSFMEMPQCTNGAQLTNNMGATIVEILDYANTNKFKTVKGIGGWENNGSGGLSLLRSSAWRSTSAINRILIYPTAGNWAQYSHFALYGIKAAS